jgi:hypothetical protein
MFSSQSNKEGSFLTVPIPSFNKMQVIPPLTTPKKVPKSKVLGDDYVPDVPLQGYAYVKHGRGLFKCTVTESVYDGEWQNDLMEGNGKFNVNVQVKSKGNLFTRTARQLTRFFGFLLFLIRNRGYGMRGKFVDQERIHGPMDRAMLVNGKTAFRVGMAHSTMGQQTLSDGKESLLTEDLPI